MLNIIKPQISVEQETADSAVFVVEPLERGFGHTLGNTMRRVLLSLLPGAAITAVQIDGIVHEFGPIKGVREDVIDLILNLKGVVVKTVTPGTYEATIDVKGPKVVTAGDIKAPGEVTIVNKDHYIAEVAEKVRFKVDLRIENGQGYVLAERNKRPEDAIGVIPIDAMFSPIKTVTYRVENTRVGQRTDYDKLVLTVKTNGAMDPRTAVSLASQIVQDHLRLFSEQAEMVLGNIFERDDTVGSPYASMPIEDLELKVRAYNCLKRHGIHTVEQLIQCTEEDLMNLRNFGQVSMEEVKKALEKHGLSFKKSSGI
jgi:DNA-directed RNA polymerase subunit alpha